MEKTMCNSCGEMFPAYDACKNVIEDGQISSYHFGCKVPKDKCTDCGLFRNVCEECCE